MRLSTPTLLIFWICVLSLVHAWISPQQLQQKVRKSALSLPLSNSVVRFLSTPKTTDSSSCTDDDSKSAVDDTTIFYDFVSFLIDKQKEIINTLEEIDGSGSTFTNDTWGIFADDENKGEGETSSISTSKQSGGITRVIQGGNVIEKGACSFTMIQQGKLSKERAKTMRSRRTLQNEQQEINEGDTYNAAALSIVLHTRSPLVPTFRSDVRIFTISSSKPVKDTNDKTTPSTIAWFGGGADLTPYYLFEDDIKEFHQMYKELCGQFDDDPNDTTFSYDRMKKLCDEYFYLPARGEHRGTGGIFFDDMICSKKSYKFVKNVAKTWMDSWLPIVSKRSSDSYSDKQREWQLLRRGRYLEFNLLYDRGVKFGLANANPRVEGVMVSAPPLVAYEYNHVIEKDSDEDKLMTILKEPIDWV